MKVTVVGRAGLCLYGWMQIADYEVYAYSLDDGVTWDAVAGGPSRYKKRGES